MTWLSDSQPISNEKAPYKKPGPLQASQNVQRNQANSTSNYLVRQIEETYRMSETDIEINEVSTVAPEEAAPAVEGKQQPEACADLAQVTESQPEACADLPQVTESLGTQTPPLKSPEIPVSTGSPTTDSGYAEAASRPEVEERDDEEALCAASLRALSSSPEFQYVGSTPSPERVVKADSQLEFGGQDMIGTSSPARDENVYETPAATPSPAPEGEEDSRTPTGALSPVHELQLRVSPKRKVENMDLDMDSSTDLPALQKKARTGSGCSDTEEDYQWYAIPPPRFTDRRLAGRCPWGGEDALMGKPPSEVSSNGGQFQESPSERPSCAVSNEDPSLGGAMGGGACAGETDSLHSAASDLTQVMTSAGPSQSQLAMLGARPKSSCSVDSRHSDFRSPPKCHWANWKETDQRLQRAPSAGVLITNIDDPDQETTFDHGAALLSTPQRKANLA